jgi:uncharacterized protein
VTSLLRSVGATCRQVPLAAIRIYQIAVRPFLPAACRFVPSCSEYGHEAITRHGLLKGGRLILHRILRCQPFAAGGFDPVR